MRRIPFSELRREEAALSYLAAVDLVPVYRVGGHAPGGRNHSALLLFEEGEYEFEWEGGRERVRQGGLIYLPDGSVHVYRALSPGIRYIRIDFSLVDPEGELLIWSSHPLLMAQSLPEESRMLCRQMCEAFLSDTLRTRMLMYTLLSRLSDQASGAASPVRQRLAPALKKLENLQEEDFSTPLLARLCGLSPTHFRRLFHELAGCTPTEYRKRLQIRYACLMLEGTELRISEIAERLGFESLYYFSRVFRAETGKSPSRWRGERR